MSDIIDRLNAIQKRVEAASDGPWTLCERTFHPISDRCRPIWNGTGAGLAFVNIWSDAEAEGDANAQFLTHAREDIPWLLAEIERLRTQRAGWAGEEPDHCACVHPDSAHQCYSGDADAVDVDSCTRDQFGKPAGWCWPCWRRFQLERMALEVERSRLDEKRLDWLQEHEDWLVRYGIGVGIERRNATGNTHSYAPIIRDAVDAAMKEGETA